MGLLYGFKRFCNSMLTTPSTGVCPLVRLLQVKNFAVPELPHCKYATYHSEQFAIPTYRCCRDVIRSGSLGRVSSTEHRCKYHDPLTYVSQFGDESRYSRQLRFLLEPTFVARGCKHGALCANRTYPPLTTNTAGRLMSGDNFRL